MTARKITVILKEIAQIENSKHIAEDRKAAALAPLKKELDQATGQTSLDEGGNASEKPAKPAK